MGLVLASGLRASPGVVPRSSTAPLQGSLPAGEQSSGAESILAVITESHSTNSVGYRLVIHNDGSATAEIGRGAGGARQSRSQQFPAGTIDAVTLRRFVEQIGDVSRIPTGFCAKSTSFGTRTEITYAGKTSGDLQCVRPQPSKANRAPLAASEELAKFIRTTLNRLKINDRRFAPAR
ncbi:MAG TPA: hypothetical protein VGZ29_13215 [Terriglobia bacterium]|nr:hypothetical protein [Terriglobia bacterium]